MSWISTFVLFTIHILFLTGLTFYYCAFIKRGGFRKLDVAIIFTLTILTIVLCSVVASSIVSFHRILLSPTEFFAIASAVAFYPLFREFTSRLSMKTSNVKHVLKNIVFYTYTGSVIDIFFSESEKRIYVHEDLLKLLSRDELEAVLQHEKRHFEQIVACRELSLLKWLTHVAYFFWILSGFLLSIMIGYLLYVFLLNTVIKQSTVDIVVWLYTIINLQVLFSTISLSVIFLTWLWEYDADLHASRTVGAAAFTNALVKVYVAKYLEQSMKYVELVSLKASYVKVPSINWWFVFRELFKQAMVQLSFSSVLKRVFVDRHPPLYLRLIAVQTQTASMLCQ